MGLLDDLMQKAGGLAGAAAQNPQAVSAVLSLLSARDGSVGGSGGLASVVSAFQQKGLGSVVSSWIATGPNPPVTGGQLTEVLGREVIEQFAAKAGVPQHQGGDLLASLLPSVIDHLTPQGEVPAADSLESSLGGLLSSFAR